MNVRVLHRKRAVCAVLLILLLCVVGMTRAQTENIYFADANAKFLFGDMYHGIREEFLQYYQDEFCYKFNRMYFGDRMFDRIVLAATSYSPTFKHRTYGSE